MIMSERLFLVKARIKLKQKNHGGRKVKEILTCLPKSSRRKLWLLLVLIIFRASIEVAGVASAYPLFSLLANAENFSENPLGAWLLEVTGVQAPSSLLLPFVAVYALILAASMLASALINVQQYRFIYALQTEITTRLLSGYLFKPYEFFLQRNVSVLTKNINVSAAEFSAGLILYGLFFISSAVVLIALILVLLLFSPWFTLSAGAMLGVIYALIVLFVRPRLGRWGAERDVRMGSMFKCVEEALTGVRDVKVSGSEHAFVEKFQVHAARYAKLNVRFQAANTAPSQLAQATVMILVAALLLGLSASGVVGSSVIPMLGVFYIAFSRMLPLGNQLYANWVTISYFWPSVDIVHSGLIEASSEGQGALDKVPEILGFKAAVQFCNVGYRYPSASDLAVRDFSCEIKFGQQVALVGPSGAGKSTILDLLLGLISPSSGDIRVDGTPLLPERVSAWRRHIGYVPQHLFLFDASLAENVAFGVAESEVDYARIEEALEKASLATLVNRLPQGIWTPLGDRGTRLSGGERQRVGIARALYRRPCLLVLDEATSALDAETEKSILSELSKLKGQITTLVVTHRLETINDCDAVFQIASGQIVESKVIN